MSNGLDSEAARRASVGVGQPWRGPGQAPTGEVDRAAAAGMYSRGEGRLRSGARLQVPIPGVRVISY